MSVSSTQEAPGRWMVGPSHTTLAPDKQNGIAPDKQVGPVNAPSQQAMMETAPDGLELTILMPCLNEAETLSVCIEKALSFLAKSGIQGEVLIADNGSTDGSQAIAERLGARVVSVPVRGYGAALYHGTFAARGRYVIMGDSDDSYDFSDLSAFVEKLRQGHDLVMGNRFRGGIAPGAMPWKNRYIGNPILSFIGRLFFRSPIGDFHCGLRGYSKAAFAQMDLRTTGMEFASEMVIKSRLFHLKVCEVPTTLRPDGRSRPPHLRPWRDGWRHLRFMLLFSPRWLFLYPGLALLAIGGALIAGTLSGPLLVGKIGFDIHTLLYACSMILIGAQLLAFGAMSKVFATLEGLHPPDRRVTWMLKHGIEPCMAFGAACLLLGSLGTLIVLGIWARASFGPLEPTKTMRWVIPSVMLLALGCQLIFNAFFVSLLGMRNRPLLKP